MPSNIMARPSRIPASSSSLYGISCLFRLIGGLLITSVVINLLYHSKLPDPQRRESRSQRQQVNGATHLRNTSMYELWSHSQAHQVVQTDRHGKVISHQISALRQEHHADASSATSNITMDQARQGREPLLRILLDAGVTDMDAASIAQLPTWQQVTDLYGDELVVVGLETCARFRDTIPRDDASIGVAGLFNTGTNPLAMYLAANCVLPHNTHDRAHGMRWQVPWGKHTPAAHKWIQTTSRDGAVNKSNVIPIVLIRDPYFWMQSMCHHAYEASWERTKSHCPNLVPSDADRERFVNLQAAESVPVSVAYGHKMHYDSLAHFWTSWYRDYLDQPPATNGGDGRDPHYPRLIVRYEDLVFRPQQLVATICECAGAVAKSPSFQYVVGEGKWGPAHKGSSNMISAMIKYGSSTHRLDGMLSEDLQYAGHHFDPELMRMFHYAAPAI